MYILSELFLLYRN